MKPFQLATALFVLVVAVGAYFWMFADPPPLPTEEEVTQGPHAPIERSEQAARASASKKPVLMPRDGELSDDDPVGDLQLEGQVLSADDLPVEGATVSLSSRPPRHKETGKDGTLFV